MMNHIAFYIRNTDNKQVLINDLIGGKVFQSLKNLNGQLFSDLTLQKLITEELRHEHFEIIKGKKNSLQKYSEGEKKKLLLKWIIGQQPDYIIVDAGDVLLIVERSEEQDIKKYIEDIRDKMGDDLL